MSQQGLLTVATSGASVLETLSSEGGPHTPPNGFNFNFSGSVAGGSAVNGAIQFITPGGPGAATNGQMDAVVLVDNVTVGINGSNQLFVKSASAMTITNINHASSPYTVLVSDEYISADVTAGVITVLLPNTTTTGRIITIKDKVGLSGTSNITLTTVGGVVTIDGVTSYAMDANYGAIRLIFDGTGYQVF
jgi:hypothetical protein